MAGALWLAAVDFLWGNLHFLGLTVGTALAFTVGQQLVYNPSRIPLRHLYWFRGLFQFLSVWLIFSFALYVLSDGMYHHFFGKPSDVACIAFASLLGLLNPVFVALKRIGSINENSATVKSSVEQDSQIAKLAITAITLIHQLVSDITYGYLNQLVARAERRISDTFYRDNILSDRGLEAKGQTRIDRLYSSAVEEIKSARAVGRFKDRVKNLHKVNHPRVKIELLLRHYGFRRLLDEYVEEGGFQTGVPFKSASSPLWVVVVPLAAAILTILQVLLKVSEWLVRQILSAFSMQ